MKCQSQKKGRLIRLWAAVMIIPLATLGCGGMTNLGRKIGIGGHKTPEINDGTPNLSREQLLLFAAQSVSGEASSEANAACSQILTNGIFNTNSVDKTDLAQAQDRRQMCSQSEQWLQDYIYSAMSDESDRSSASGSGTKFGFDLIEKSLPASRSVSADLDHTNQNSSADRKKYTKEDAKHHAENFRAMYCSASDTSTASENTYAMKNRVVDQGIVKAWEACITKSQGGFFCHAEDTETHVLMQIKWVPTALAAPVLPRVRLTWQTLENLEVPGVALPATLGAGSGLSVALRRNNPDQPSALQVNASDGGNNVNFSCSRSVKPFRKGSVRLHTRCGVALYNEGTISLNKGRGPACGIEKYNEARTPSCGVESLKVGSDMNCAGSIVASSYFKSEESSCGGRIEDYHLACNDSSHVRIREPRRTSSSCWNKPTLDWRTRDQVSFICSIPDRPGTCRAERFGVEAYNSCRHPNHGIAEYAECHHASFGDVKERRPEFGVERYNSCFVFNDEL